MLQNLALLFIIPALGLGAVKGLEYINANQITQLDIINKSLEQVAR